MRIGLYIKVPYFTSFRFPASSIVGLGLGLVVGLGTVLVLFFIAFSPFRCMLKDRKLQPLQVPPPWYSGYGTVLIESRVRGSIPVRFLKSSLSKFSVTVSFSLNITFRVRVNSNMRHL